MTCSDGSFNPDNGKGSLGWIISTTDKVTLAKGAGPVDGNPSSSYRSELGGLIAVLYIIYKICHYYQVTDGKIKYHCDNKGVIRNVFSSWQQTISQFLGTDYDLVHTAQLLLHALPITVVAEWVKGHYDGDYREHKHDLNDEADRLATNFNKRPPTGFIQKKMPSSIPNYAVQLLHDGSTITT